MRKFGLGLGKVCLRWLRICAAVYILLCIGCASFQRRLIYFPPSVTPAEVEREAASQNLTRWTDSHGAPIGWKRLSPVQPALGQVLITHGNACCAFECGQFADAIQQVAPLDIYLVEYPGYENRPGSPTERSLYAAADEALELLPTNRPTYLVGESLGTGVATYLAGKHPNQVSGVVLLAPFNSLVSVGQAHMRIFPVGLILADRFPSEEHLHTYQGPIAVLVGGRDPVVPERFGRRLYDAYQGPKRLWEFPEGDHGTVMLQPPEIWKQIFDFLQANSLSINSLPEPEDSLSAAHRFVQPEDCYSALRDTTYGLEQTRKGGAFYLGCPDMMVASQVDHKKTNPFVCLSRCRAFSVRE